MTIDTTESKIDELLTRSVEEVIPSKKELKEVLLSGQKLRIYIGTDATGTSLHLGHATNYIILEKFRQLGHEVIFLVGDFTSRIGDPTDKGDAARKQLTREEVIENTKTWIDQVKPVIDVDNAENPVKVLFNHDWLAKLTFEDVINLASNFTVQQMIERDMFEKRMTSGKPLYLHELFYPLMQGYDSVAMDVDIEMCGMDQKFNALAGRTLLRKLKEKEKFVFITRLLENPITGEKMMSKSLGTGVFLDFDEVKMYGVLMAQADENMKQLFVDCTMLSLEDVEEILATMNPRDAKMRLAFEVVRIYHGQEGAERAQNQFIETFQKGGIPDDVVEIKPNYVEALLAADIVASKTELRRLLEAGGVRDAESGEKLLDIPTSVTNPQVLKIGKRRFVKLIP
jgi:tyrosyl-tRNA synthetase